MYVGGGNTTTTRLLHGKIKVLFREREREQSEASGESRAERERSALNTASRLDMAKAVCKGGEKSRGQTLVRIAGSHEETVAGGREGQETGLEALRCLKECW